MNFPKIRLPQLIEAANPQLDAVFSADADTETLCRILWMTTRTRPKTACRRMRAKNYRALSKKMQIAGQRVAGIIG